MPHIQNAGSQRLGQGSDGAALRSDRPVSSFPEPSTGRRDIDARFSPVAAPTRRHLPGEAQ